jgi:hypothetical protein
MRRAATEYRSRALPSVIYGGAFSLLQSGFWAAQPSVRKPLTTGAASPTLPVNVDTSLLLGVDLLR